jgi:hypothetical protein
MSTTTATLQTTTDGLQTDRLTLTFCFGMAHAFKFYFMLVNCSNKMNPINGTIVSPKNKMSFKVNDKYFCFPKKQITLMF